MEGYGVHLSPRFVLVSKLRQQLELRAESRRAQRRFRQDPVVYLAKLEQQLLH